jgi:intergrase/recombinase
MSNFWTICGSDLIQLAVALIFATLGFVAKTLITKFLNTKEKRQLAKDVVLYVEQKFTELHGEQKFKKAVEAFTQILVDRGINTTVIEIETLIEAALGSFNDTFSKTK